MVKDIRELLDDYYGESRSDDHKQEIVEFVRNYSYELYEILKREMSDFQRLEG